MKRSLDPCCPDCGSVPCSCPMIRAPRRVEPDARTTLDQDVWWETLDGITHLIDDLGDIHRINIAAKLVRDAERLYAIKRRVEIEGNYWSFVVAAEAADWGPVIDEPPTPEEIKRRVAEGVERGEHLAWIRGTKLFKRMVRGIDPTHLKPGTLSAGEMRVVYERLELTQAHSIDF